MNTTYRNLVWVGVAAGMLASSPVFAQKSKDTVRIAAFDPVRGLDLAIDPRPEVGFTSRWIQDGLLYFDEREMKLRPALAKSWKQINPTTYEFELQQGVKYHDGSAFDADDVVYALSWMFNPKTKSRAKTSWTWMKSVEKLGPYKVRVTAKRPTSNALFKAAYSMPIYPSDVHSSYKNNLDFARKPVGAGPYRATEVDVRNGRATIERVEGYKHGHPWRQAGSVKRIQMIHVPERQTQVAQLLTGGVDMIRNPQRDQGLQLRKDPRFEVTVRETLGIGYLSMDALNRSGAKALLDIRVRRAIAMAVNRQAIATKIYAGGKPLANICRNFQLACKISAKQQPHDPAGAKKLLAEAGYPDGFELEITALTGLLRPMAVAVSGDLRKVGIKTTVQTLGFVAYRKKSNAGKLQLLAGWYTSSGLPDAGMWIDFFFAPAKRNYWQDKQIAALRLEGHRTFDPQARDEVYRKAFDRIAEQTYMVPVTSLPAVVVHTKDIKLKTGGFSSFGMVPGDINWK